MAILFPNVPATLHRQRGYDLQGKAVWAVSGRIKVAIVRLRNKLERSSVRADSSASRGRSDETRADGVILVPPEVEIGLQDRLTIMGAFYEITSVFPRFGLGGELGHNQVELRILASG
jgi:hypothetical protein